MTLFNHECEMGKYRKGGYIFVTWSGDHRPRHVHIFRNRRLILKWNPEDGVAMKGKTSSRVLRLIKELQMAGKL